MVKRVTCGMCRGSETGIPYALQEYLQDRLEMGLRLTEDALEDYSFEVRDDYFCDVFGVLNFLRKIEVLSYFNYLEVSNIFISLYLIYTKEELEDWKKC